MKQLCSGFQLWLGTNLSWNISYFHIWGKSFKILQNQIYNFYLVEYNGSTSWILHKVLDIQESNLLCIKVLDILWSIELYYILYYILYIKRYFSKIICVWSIMGYLILSYLTNFFRNRELKMSVLNMRCLMYSLAPILLLNVWAT